MTPSKKTIAFLLAVIVAAGFSVRVLNFRSSIDPRDREIIFSDNDAPYHAYRIFGCALGQRSKIQFHDPRSYFPQGHVCHWSPGFDWLLGAVGKFFFSLFPDEFALKQFISFLIPLWGSLTALLYYVLARSFFDPRQALLACLLLMALPFHITGAYFAVLDHHVAEYFFIILLYVNILNLPRKYAPFCFGTCNTVSFFIVPGFLLDYLLFFAGTMIFTLVGWTWEQTGRHLRNLVEAQWITLFFLTPVCLFTYYGTTLRWDSLSLFHAIVVFIAAGATSFFYLFNRRSSGRSGMIPPILLGALLLSGAFFIPNFISQFSAGLGFIQGDALIKVSKEITSFSFRFLSAGYLKVLWPFMLLGVAVIARDAYRKRCFLRLIIVSSSFLYACLAVEEIKFLRYVLITGILFGLYGVFRLYLYASVRKEIARFYLVCLAVLVGYGGYDYHKLFSLNRPAPNMADYRVVRFLKNHYVPGKNGDAVFANWSIGHKLIYYTGFANMDNPFLSRDKIEHTRDFIRYNLSTSEAEGEGYLSKYHAELVVVDPITNQLEVLLPILDEPLSDYFTDNRFTPKFYRSLNTRLFFYDGNAVSKNHPPILNIPALTRHRLVYETPEQTVLQNRRLPEYKVFENVRGAKIRILPGDGPPPATLGLKLQTNTGRIFYYEQKILKSIEKEIILRVPYAAPGRNGKTLAVSPYFVASDEKSVAVSVSEADVRNGNTISVVF